MNIYPQNLTSQTISSLRFPLAVMVVTIHARTLDDMDFTPVWPLVSGMDIALGLQVLFSSVVCHVAVPIFYVMSGYLFFYKLPTFDGRTYKSKLRKRIKTLFVPYLLWNLMQILFTVLLKVAGVVVKGKPLDGIADYLQEHAGIATFWDCNMWNLWRTNWVGQNTPPTGPILVPMWFLRDLMVIVILTPIIYFLLRHFKHWALLLFAVCYVTGIWPYIHGFSITAMFFFSLGAYFSINGKDLVGGLDCLRLPAYIIYVPMTMAMLLFDSRNTWWEDHLYPFYIMISVVAVFCLFADLTSRGRCNRLRDMQRYAFFIYGAHAVFGLPIAYGILQLVPGHDTHWTGISASYLLSIALSVLICICSQKLLLRFCPKLLSSLVGSR